MESDGEYSVYELLYEQAALLKKYGDAKRRNPRLPGARNPQIVAVLEEMTTHLGRWTCIYGNAIVPSMQRYIQGYINVADAVITGKQCGNIQYYMGELSQGSYMLADYFATFGTIREEFFREWGFYQVMIFSVMLDGASINACEAAILNASKVVEHNLRHYTRDNRCFPKNHP